MLIMHTNEYLHQKTRGKKYRLKYNFDPSNFDTPFFKTNILIPLVSKSTKKIDHPTIMIKWHAHY